MPETSYKAQLFSAFIFNGYPNQLGLKADP